MTDAPLHLQNYEPHNNSINNNNNNNEDIDIDIDSNSDSNSDLDDTFYTPGPSSLLTSRRLIADYSLSHAQSRLQSQYATLQSFNATQNLIARRRHYENISKLSLQGTQLLSNRFTSSLAYNSNLNLLAAGSWNGSCYFLDPSTLSINKSIPNLHPEKLSALHWSTSNQNHNILATGGSDGIINLISNLNLDVPTITQLNEHLDRINDVQFHPLQSYLISASSDLTWRLWDIPKQSQLYYQEGHTDAINSISIHPDGSLIASGGNDSIIKLWDLRSGMSILNLSQNNGHIKPIHSLKWRFNGFHLASGGADNQLIIWDIRKADNLISVPIHNKLITSINFNHHDNTMISTSYDGTLCLTATDSWKPIKKFSNLDKIMCSEIIDNDDNNFTIFTGGWDRSIKLFI